MSRGHPSGRRDPGCRMRLLERSCGRRHPGRPAFRLFAAGSGTRPPGLMPVRRKGQGLSPFSGGQALTFCGRCMAGRSCCRPTSLKVAGRKAEASMTPRSCGACRQLESWRRGDGGPSQGARRRGGRGPPACGPRGRARLRTGPCRGWSSISVGWPGPSPCRAPAYMGGPEEQSLSVPFLSLLSRSGDGSGRHAVMPRR